MGHFCCPGRTRTLASGTRIRCATITPQDNSELRCKVRHYFLTGKHWHNFFEALFEKNNNRQSALRWCYA